MFTNSDQTKEDKNGSMIDHPKETTVKTCITKLSIGQAALANPALK
jgi:hypothetical protein